MIIDTMTQKEVMKSLQKEFNEEILPYYNNSILKWAEKYVLPIVQKSGKPKTYSKSKVSSGRNKLGTIYLLTQGLLS